MDLLHTRNIAKSSSIVRIPTMAAAQQEGEDPNAWEGQLALPTDRREQQQEALGMFRKCKMWKCIGYTPFSHAFALAESNGTIYFALRGLKRLPQEPSKIPPNVPFSARPVAAS